MVFGFGKRKMAQDLRNVIREAARELPDISSPSFGAHFDQFGNSRLVLIGDGSHGTSEFYRARAAITKRLITEHGFNTVCIEGDWPDARVIDRYTRLHPPPPKSASEPGPDMHKMRIFDHFPRWMWRNEETQEFVDWLRSHNAGLPMHRRVSFNGLDVYSMGASIRAVIEYLDRLDPQLAKQARRHYSCLERWLDDPAEYGRATFRSKSGPCEAGVVKMLQQLLEARLQLATSSSDEDGGGGESFLDAEMNARVVRDAESYYRAMYKGDSTAWNQRDRHMYSILARLLKLRPGSKAVVWAHNSHLGDARGSSMGVRRGEVNLGQLCRENFSSSSSGTRKGDEVCIIGCGTHTGTVAAADEWDEPMQVMAVNPSRADSYERVMHDVGLSSFLLVMRQGQGQGQGQGQEGISMGDTGMMDGDMEPRLQRFIGVIYRPDTERYSHYIESILNRQYDAFVFFDETEAVHPFETAQPKEPLARGETYPFGL